MVSTLLHRLCLGFDKHRAQHRIPSHSGMPFSQCGFSRQRVFPTVSISNKASYAHAVPPWQEQALDAWTSNSQSAASCPDRWMENSVADIVKNINEAPFLHLLYESQGNSVKSERQVLRSGQIMATDERWKEVKESVKQASPDGLILVQELDQEEAKFDGGLLPDASHKTHGHDGALGTVGSSRLWGVLVLGRNRAQCACYILETTSVTSTFGRCTRFALTKAQQGGPSFLEQMQNSWLQS